jgi:hypothetical protein
MEGSGMGKTQVWLAVASAVPLSAFALAACGGDNSADEDEITAAIVRAATSGDPAACTDVQTVNFVQQTSGEPGDSAEEALKSCQQEADDTVADEVDVTDIEVDGDTATAEAAVTGSFFDSQTLDIGLVKEGDQWKLDDFNGFVDFDQTAMAGSIEQGLKDEGASPQATDCVTNRIETLPADQVEAAFVGNDPKAEDQIFEPCSKFFNE